VTADLAAARAAFATHYAALAVAIARYDKARKGKEEKP